MIYKWITSIIFNSFIGYDWYTVGFCCCCCSVAKSCPTLCNPVDCSTPDFPVLRYLLEFVQTYYMEQTSFPCKLSYSFLSLGHLPVFYFLCFQCISKSSFNVKCLTALLHLGHLHSRPLCSFIFLSSSLLTCSRYVSQGSWRKSFSNFIVSYFFYISTNVQFDLYSQY